MNVSNILCEYLLNPLGIDIKHPRITWNDEGLVEQTAYQIAYSINGHVYETEIIETNNMFHVFDSQTFNSKDLVTYKIRIRNENNEWSNYSSENFFQIGLLNKKDWKAKWISGNYKPNKKDRYPVDYFKKEFNVTSTKNARLYITACGLYEAYINNKRVGDFILAPGSTDPRKRIQYQVYDISNLLVEGRNEIKVLLADGWYRGSIGAKGVRCVFGKETRLLAQLEINNETVLCSDKNWSFSNDGAIIFADLKDGEIIDSRKTPSFKYHAKEAEFKANLTASNNYFVNEEKANLPINFYKLTPSKTVIEFKNNVAGYIAFDVYAKAGDEIRVTMGELLNEDREVSLKNIQLTHKRKITPLQEVKYICKEGLNSYKGRFYFAGFKYIQVETTIDFDPMCFKQIPLHTYFEETSTFECSNELMNIFYENTLRSLKSNSIDIPTDCPTRERMGWTGDSQVFFDAASYLTNYAAFTRKHIVDVFDRQDKNGRLPQIAPFSAEDWFMDVMNGSVGWADVGILTPYRYYKKYGDKRLLENNFDNMERYAKFMIKRCGRAKGLYALYAKPLHLSKANRKYGVNTGQSYGEWAEPNDVKAFVWTDFCEPHAEESMAYTHWMMSLMVEICDLLGRTNNKTLYEEYRDGIKLAYQELVTKKKHTLDTNRQAKLVRPLYLNLLNEEQTKYATKRLIEALNYYRWRLGTGFLSTPFILDVLSKINVEYAYKLLENEEMPGWLYMAKNNTGTIWEAWEGPTAQAGIASLNHYSKGAVTEWFVRGMCGIIIKGNNSFVIKPIIGGKETYAKASYKSIYGLISSSWEKKGDKIHFEISIPANTLAEFEYNGFKEILKSGKHVYEI